MYAINRFDLHFPQFFKVFLDKYFSSNPFIRNTLIFWLKKGTCFFLLLSWNKYDYFKIHSMFDLVAFSDWDHTLECDIGLCYQTLKEHSHEVMELS